MKINLTVELTLPQDKAKLIALGDVLGAADLIAAATPTPPAPPAEPKVRKPRAEKAEVRGQDNVPGDPATFKPAPAAPVALTEEQSKEKLQTVGEAFVQRFSKQADGVDEVKKILEGTYKVSRLRDLVHAQRVDLISTLEARIKEADAKKTQAAPPVGLGL